MKEELYFFISLIISGASLLISFIGIIFVYQQVKKMNDQLTYDKSVVRRQKALDMSKEFQQLISNELGYVKNSLRNHQYLQFDKDKDISREFYEFDKEEAFRLFNVKSVEELNKFIEFNSINKTSLILAYMEKYAVHDEKMMAKLMELYKFYSNPENYNKAPQNFPDINQIMTKMAMKFNENQLSLMNKLEWMAMHFNSNLADAELVYQSLHQTFLDTVSILYLNIVVLNSKVKNENEQYYQHLTKLYRKWKDISLEKEKELIKEELRLKEAKKKIVRPQEQYAE